MAETTLISGDNWFNIIPLYRIQKQYGYLEQKRHGNGSKNLRFFLVFEFLGAINIGIAQNKTVCIGKNIVLPINRDGVKGVAIIALIDSCGRGQGRWAAYHKGDLNPQDKTLRKIRCR